METTGNHQNYTDQRANLNIFNDFCWKKMLDIDLQSWIYFLRRTPCICQTLFIYSGFVIHNTLWRRGWGFLNCSLDTRFHLTSCCCFVIRHFLLQKYLSLTKQNFNLSKCHWSQIKTEDEYMFTNLFIPQQKCHVNTLRSIRYILCFSYKLARFIIQLS